MKQTEYWKKRAEELEEALHQQTIRKSEEIDEQFDKAYHALDGQIKAWYQRVAVNNQVSLQEARKLLNNKERKEFQWDIEEYIKHGKENGLNGQWMRELENASAKQHISRLEQIKIQTQQEAEKLYGNYVDEIDQHMRDTYREDYYRTAYNFQMGAGVGYDLAGIDEKALERVIRKPWAADGKNFTDRCWEGKDNLVHTLHTTLTQMCITGEGIDSASGKFRKAVDVGKYQADRLIRTESAYFQTAAQKDCYSELGVSEVEIMATLDEATCDICGALDGTHLPLAEAEEGVSTPPFHCNCRCTTVPYYGDTLGMDGRAMRDADGGYDTVPSDLKFEDWKKRYVGNDRNSIDWLKDNEIKSSGGIYGAYNDKNDPDYRKREKIGRDLYTEITNRKKSFEIRAVSKNSGLSIDEVSRIYDHMFVRKHLLSNGTKVSKFDPDYYMAHSWIRVREGKNIQAHDLTMLYHELEEEKIMGESLEVKYEMAHNKAQKKFNYAKELQEYLKTHDA
jgi:SPP1 gp7 family putative phage head morphogenesis protein